MNKINTKNTEIPKNIFEDIAGAFAPEEQPGDAWDKGLALAEAAAAGQYKSLTKANLIRLLEAGLDHAMEAGHKPEHLLNMFSEGSIPSDGDARMGVIMLPSYALCAVGIYAMNHCKSRIRVRYREALQKLLDRAFIHGTLSGHGFDAREQAYLTMAMFSKAEAKLFLETEPEFSEGFQTAMEGSISAVYRALEQASTEDTSLEILQYRSRLQQVLYRWAYPDEKTEQVFVYGTLMTGQSANSFLSGCECLGNALLREYAVYDLGAYPGIRPAGNETAVGELWKIPAGKLAELDQYECEGELYHRIILPVETAEGMTYAWVYMYAGQPEGKLIRGRWNPDGSEKVWYAAYGSSLSRDRFNCYIYGGTLEDNGRTYTGCHDKTPWKYGGMSKYPGSIYYGNSSPSWGGAGVAFYDPAGNSEVFMRLYGIRWGQLLDVQAQEGRSDNWYGKITCPGIRKDGIPVYTLTSVSRRPANEPSEAYIALCRKALVEECGIAEDDADEYLEELRTKQ